MFEVMTPNSASSRSRVRPARCRAAIVFSNVGGSGLPAMAAISARSSASAAANAAGNSSGATDVPRRHAAERPGPRRQQRVSAGLGLRLGGDGCGGLSRRCVRPRAGGRHRDGERKTCEK